LAAKILTTFKQQVKDLKLIPSGGGCFELTVDKHLVYSKRKTGEFPDEQKMLDEMSRHAGSAAAK
jgi:selenoprotein W-related protein